MRIPFLFTLLYILSIPLINYLFVKVTPFVLHDGTYFSPITLLVGTVFILRDFCQREVGTRGALVAIMTAASLTYVVSTPELAIASVVAFTVAELADWAVYTLTRRPFAERVLYSSLLAGPIDSAVFLWGASSVFPDMKTWSAFALYSIIKVMLAVGAYFVLSLPAIRKKLG
ncbi:MAG: hypothetical protein WAZ18_01830 [Alphaproteobacteria bacterium]